MKNEQQHWKLLQRKSWRKLEPRKIVTLILVDFLFSQVIGNHSCHLKLYENEYIARDAQI